MKKAYALTLPFFLSCMLPLESNAAAFEVYEDFDVDSHFTESTSVPDGWVSDGGMPFSRMEAGAYTIGFDAYNGSYVFYTGSSNESSRTEVVYTPMMKLAAGQPCTIEFQVYAPGNGSRKNGFVVKAGMAQNADAQTISVKTLDLGNYAEWTPVKGTFIPEEEGEYCFSIALQTNLSQALWVGIDDVIISGTAPDEIIIEPDDPIDLEPNPEHLSECIDLPYLERYEGENYDGTRYLPIGWLTTGTVIWRTAADKPAYSGDYYMIAPEAGVAHDERAYTPFFLLTAGTEYSMSFYLYMDEGSISGNFTTLDFTVGTEQDSDFHNSLKKMANYANTGWEKIEVSFTPEKSGAYCFSFSLSSEEGYSGIARVDDFLITAPGLVSRVEPNFTIPALSNLNDGSLLAFWKVPYTLVNQSENADSYQWEVEGAGAELSDATAENPQVTFDRSGTYTIQLTAKNARGERTTTKSLDVTFLNSDQENLPLLINNQTEDGSPLTKGQIPAFKTHEVDYVSGPNHYYRKYAERIDLPEDYEFNLRTMTFFLTNLNYVPVTASGTYPTQTECAISIVFYGAKADGSLDEDNVLSRSDKTLGEVFGTTGIGSQWGEPSGWDFSANPVKLSGPVYVAFEYDEDFIIDEVDATLGRSVVSLALNEHKSEITTLYAKPYAVPENATAKADGNWYAVDEIDSSMRGLGLYLVLWVDATVPEGIPVIPDLPDTPDDGSVAINSAGEIVFAVRADDSNIFVSGTKAGEPVFVYGVNGALVASATGTENRTIIPASHLGKGLYIVRTGVGTQKLVK